MTITTLDDSMAANGSAATLTVYGEKGKTKDIELKKDGAFEPGNVDEFDDVSFIEKYFHSVYYTLSNLCP